MNFDYCFIKQTAKPYSHSLQINIYLVLSKYEIYFEILRNFVFLVGIYSILNVALFVVQVRLYASDKPF